MPNLHRLISQRIQTHTLILLACAATVFGALAPATASASHTQAMYFEAPRDLLEVTPAARTKALAQLQSLGVKALRVELYWANVAPGAHSTKKPTFEATNPAAYDWGAYDVLLFEAARLKWQVLLTVTSPVPEWATASHKDKSGVTRPNAADFKEFMTAVGKHYAGFVSLYAIWNEPNHPAFLQPQFNSKGMPESPRIYRGLFQAGYEGLRASGIAKPKVLMGETAPVGADSLSRREIKERGLVHDVAPLAFLRGALCLNSKYQKAEHLRNAACLRLRSSRLHDRSRSALQTIRGADNVMIGVLSRLSSALDKAERAHAIPAHTPIYLTEFGIQSYPNTRTWCVFAKAGRIRRDRREDRLGKPARGGFLAVPAARRPARGPSRLKRARRLRRLPDWPGDRQRHAQAAVLRLPRSAGRLKARARLLAVGARAPHDGADHAEGARAAEGVEQDIEPSPPCTPTRSATGR